MYPLRFCFFLFAFLAVSFLTAFADDKNKLSGQVQPRGNGFSISKETTFFLGPLTKEGYLDYLTALNKALSQDVPPEENANILLWKIMGPKPEGGKGLTPEYYTWLGMKAPPDEGNYYLRSWVYARQVLKIPQGRIQEFLDQLDSSARKPWKEPEYSNIAFWLKGSKDHLANLAEAVKRKKYYNPLIPFKAGPADQGVLAYSLLPNTQFCRDFASALASRSMLHLGEGRVDEAWQDALTCMRLGRLIGQGGSLIEGLAGIAIETIGQKAAVKVVFHNPEKGKIRSWQKDLESLPPLADLRLKINLTERAVFLDSLQHIIRVGPKEGLTLLDRIQPGAQPKLKGLPEKYGAIDWDPAFRLGNLWFNRIYQQMAIEKFTDRMKRWDEMEQELKGLKKELEAATAKFDPEKIKWADYLGKIAVAEAIPATRVVQGALGRVGQSHTNLSIAMALAIYKIEKGKYPDTLDALTPKYISKIPYDFFSDEPIKYMAQGEGFLLYSVGVNGQDEGGHFLDDNPPGDDLVIRVPIPNPKPAN